MLKNNLRKKSEGFTIIEVMIVLAIAGLILLIVLLAVPALRRNATNTTIKNDASTVAGGINEFESNNNGAAPTTATNTTISGATGTNPTTISVSGSTTVTSAAAGTAPSLAITANNIKVYFGYQCNSSVSSPSSAAIVYYVAGNSQGNCQTT